MNHPAPPQTIDAEPRAAVFSGWHDSSLELKLGLVVTEHGALDPLGEASPWQTLGPDEAAHGHAQP